MKTRLQKVLAAAGLASRRASEQIILAGRVAVNGQTVSQLGVQVDPEEDRISVDGRPVHSRRKLYLALNKPKGYLCTRRDPEHRHTVGELLPHEWADVYPVGRLDYDTEGLLFLTNDGEFCLHLTHPRYGITKRYLVTVDGRIEPDALRSLTRGVVHTGERLTAEQARLLHASSSYSVFELVLKEGRNREVRRMCETQDWRVRQLRRTQIGPIKLGELRPGKWRLLTPPEIDRLLAAVPEPPAAQPHPRAVRSPVKDPRKAQTLRQPATLPPLPRQTSVSGSTGSGAIRRHRPPQQH